MTSKHNLTKSCDCPKKLTSASRNIKNLKHPKKVIQSKTVCYYPGNAKSCSTGAIYEAWNSKRRNYTKSDFAFPNKTTRKESIDFCKKCGDQIQTKSDSSKSDNSNVHNVRSERNIKNIHSELKNNKNKEGKSKLNDKNAKCNGVKQYYKNESFHSSDSIEEVEVDLRKISLETIKEVPDASSSGVNIYDVLTDSKEEVGFMDTNAMENIDKIKKFRTENYYECHSIKARVDNKGSVTTLRDHKCMYRFYLNDRLFPVPLHSDYQNNIRCIECHLPIDLKYDALSNKPNGTIQAKVKINDKEQDMILLLPVKESLVIKEKRKQIKTEDEVLYFGVVKLNTYGNSIFNSTLPSDSLALKYQKGYKEFSANDDYKYKGVERNDVIVI